MFRLTHLHVGERLRGPAASDDEVVIGSEVDQRPERFRLAGDAAHLNSPVGGPGMNLGIGDAVNLGAKLAAVHQGASPEILDRYEVERRPVAEYVLEVTRRGTAMLTGRRPLERFFRNQFMRVAHRLPPVQRQLSTEAAFMAQGGREAVSEDAAEV